MENHASDAVYVVCEVFEGILTGGPCPVGVPYPDGPEVEDAVAGFRKVVGFLGRHAAAHQYGSEEVAFSDFGFIHFKAVSTESP